MRVALNSPKVLSSTLVMLRDYSSLIQPWKAVWFLSFQGSSFKASNLLSEFFPMEAYKNQPVFGTENVIKACVAIDQKM